MDGRERPDPAHQMVGDIVRMLDNEIAYKMNRSEKPEWEFRIAIQEARSGLLEGLLSDAIDQTEYRRGLEFLEQREQNLQKELDHYGNLSRARQAWDASGRPEVGPPEDNWRQLVLKSILGKN